MQLQTLKISTRFLSGLTLLLACIIIPIQASAVPAITSPRFYSVSIFNTNNSNSMNDIRRLASNLQRELRAHRGNFVTDPIRISREFDNPGRPGPSVARNHPGDVLLIAEFRSASRRNAFDNDRDVIRIRGAIPSRTPEIIRFQGTSLGPTAFALPNISNNQIRRGSAYLLLNALTLRLSRLPGFIAYSTASLPELLRLGTRTFAPINVTRNLKGNYGFRMLSITDWRSINTLNQFHNSRSFLSRVRLRNAGLSRLTDSLARPQR